MMIHLFRWEPSAVAVPPRGNPLGSKYRMGTWQCVTCRVSYGFAEEWGMDSEGNNECPGAVAPVRGAGPA
jgi:hypothetical protein